MDPPQTRLASAEQLLMSRASLATTTILCTALLTMAALNLLDSNECDPGRRVSSTVRVVDADGISPRGATVWHGDREVGTTGVTGEVDAHFDAHDHEAWTVAVDGGRPRRAARSTLTEEVHSYSGTCVLRIQMTLELD